MGGVGATAGSAGWSTSQPVSTKAHRASRAWVGREIVTSDRRPTGRDHPLSALGTAGMPSLKGNDYDRSYLAADNSLGNSRECPLARLPRACLNLRK